ncbi:MAG: peptidase S16 [Nitriliruptorales bacterium]|nr:peptidase S16 [Nitriliruptorales bacterium]
MGSMSRTVAILCTRPVRPRRHSLGRMELPLFPLHTVLFPGRPLPLHVFEQRYRDMLRDCLESDRRFGVVAIRSGAEVGPGADLFEVGTIAEIERVEQLPGGGADIVTRGTQRFRIGELVPGTPYLRAQAEPIADSAPVMTDIDRARALRNRLITYLGALGAPDEMLARIPTAPAPLAWLAAATLQVEVHQQQQLLEVEDCGRRLDLTLGLLRREAGIVRHFGTVGALRPVVPGGTDLN